MSNPEIKPCPFCGAKAEGPYNETAGSSRDDRWTISCRLHCVGMHRKRKKDVISDWNKRTESKLQAVADEVEGRKKAIRLNPYLEKGIKVAKMHELEYVLSTLTKHLSNE